MGWFGKREPEGKTVLVVDVENGSVGSALMHFKNEGAPRLFGEQRNMLRVLPTRDSRSLFEEVTSGLHHTLAHASTVAARLRQHEATTPLGTITSAAVYLGAPWGQPNLLQGTPDFVGIMRDAVTREMHSLGIPHSIYTAAGGVLGGVQRTLPDDTYLLCIVGGEVTELVFVHNSTVGGYATIPTGTHTVVRTLRAHGVSDHEAHSATRLFTDTLYQEPLRATAMHFASEIGDAAERIMGKTPVRRIWVVSRGANTDFFARALSSSPELDDVFSHGGEVRALRSSHVAPFIAAHNGAPDVLLGLHSLHAQVV